MSGKQATLFDEPKPAKLFFETIDNNKTVDVDAFQLYILMREWKGIQLLLNGIQLNDFKKVNPIFLETQKGNWKGCKS